MIWILFKMQQDDKKNYCLITLNFQYHNKQQITGQDIHQIKDANYFIDNFQKQKFPIVIYKDYIIIIKLDSKQLNSRNQHRKCAQSDLKIYHQKCKNWQKMELHRKQKYYLQMKLFLVLKLYQKDHGLLDMRNKIQTHALVSAISMDKGLETFMIKKKSINQDDFIEFLQKINDVYPDQEIIIFMDNLSVHKTRRVKEAMKEFNQKAIYNVPYSPQYNGIESYFFLVKQKYKKLLLKNIRINKDLNVKYMIKQSINAVQEYKTMNCAKGGVNEIMKII